MFTKIFLFIFSTALLFTPLVVDADTQSIEGQKIEFGLTNPLDIEEDFDLIDVLNLIVDAAMYLAIPIIVLLIIYTGLKFVMARGNDKEITDAKKMFFYVVIGAAIILGAKLIIEIVQNTVNSFKS